MDRTDRIAEEIKKELSKIIQNELKDPRITGLISVTKVTITKDLKYCKVYVSIFSDKKEEALKGIKSGVGYMRKEIGSRVKIRITPELEIILDDSMEYGERIDRVLKNI